MIKCTMLIPVKDTNGIPVDYNAMGRHLYDILTLCGGYTRSEPKLHGAWRDEQGKVYFDTLFSVMVCCDDEKLPALRRIAGQIAATCKQECLYFDYQPITVEYIEPCAK